MLLKRFHDDNESIVALKRFCTYKNSQSMDLEWNGTGGFQKHWSRVSIRVQEDCGKHRKHQSVE